MSGPHTIAGRAPIRRLRHDWRAVAARRGAHGMVECRLRFPVDHTAPEATMLAAALLNRRMLLAPGLRALGAEAAAHADQDHLLLGVSAPVAVLDEVLRRVTDLARAPEREPAIVARVAREHADLLAMAREDQGMRADEEVNGLIYGAHHPYGRRLDAERLAATGHEDVTAAVDRALGAPGARLVAVGDADDERLTASLAGAVDALAPHGDALPRFPAPRPIRATDELVTVPGQAGATLRLVCPAPPAGHPDLPALELAVALLGGGPTSVLFRRLRHELGLVYGVGARIVHAAAAGAVVVSVTTDARHDGRVRAELQAAADAAAADPAWRSPADLARAARQLGGARQVATSTPAGLADRLVADWVGAIDPRPAVGCRRHALAEVGPQELHAVAARYLGRSRRVLLTVRGTAGS